MQKRLKELLISPCTQDAKRFCFMETPSHEKIVQPKETVQFYYEIAVAIIIVPAILLLASVLIMRRRTPVISYPNKKSSPI